MTDNEIIKGLECCCKNNNCEGCPLDYLTFSSQCTSELAIKSLNLINRQKANYESLKAQEEKEHQYCKNVCEPKYKAEIKDLNHSVDTLYRVKEQLKETLTETEAKYQKEITRLEALLVCKNKVIRGLEKSFENAYDGAIKEFAERLKNIYIRDKRYDRPNAHTLIDWLFNNIDNLVKEMAGEDK